jgi:hypothetical protein
MDIVISIIVMAWSMFSWIIETFGVWILIIYIVINIINSKNIRAFFVGLWNLFGNNYNSSYPVFSRLEIGEAKNHFINLNSYWWRMWEKYSKLKEKEEKKGHIKNSDINSNVKYCFKEYVRSSLEATIARKKFKFMIESNIAVQNGKKSIDEAYREFDKKFRDLEKKHKDEAEENYKSWENL